MAMKLDNGAFFKEKIKFNCYESIKGGLDYTQRTVYVKNSESISKM